MSKAFHCDSDDCDAWTFHRNHHGFLTVKGQGKDRLHFCSWDCVLKFSAKFEPMQIIASDGEMD